MKRAEFISFKGKKILYIDFSHCSSQEVLQIIEDSKAVISSQPKRSLLTLTNVQNAHFNPRVVEAMKEYALHNKEYVLKGAVIGLSGIQKVIYNAVMRSSQRNLPCFDNCNAAKEWLVDRRVHPRTKEKIKVEFCEKGEARRKKAVSVNLSIGGIRMLSRDDLSKGTVLELFLKIPFHDDALQLTGTVIWVRYVEEEESYLSGIAFQNIEDDVQHVLYEFLYDSFEKNNQ